MELKEETDREIDNLLKMKQFSEVKKRIIIILDLINGDNDDFAHNRLISYSSVLS